MQTPALDKSAESSYHKMEALAESYDCARHEAQTLDKRLTELRGRLDELVTSLREVRDKLNRLIRSTDSPVRVMSDNTLEQRLNGAKAAEKAAVSEIDEVKAEIVRVTAELKEKRAEMTRLRPESERLDEYRKAALDRFSAVGAENAIAADKLMKRLRTSRSRIMLNDRLIALGDRALAALEVIASGADNKDWQSNVSAAQECLSQLSIIYHSLGFNHILIPAIQFYSCYSDKVGMKLRALRGRNVFRVITTRKIDAYEITDKVIASIREMKRQSQTLADEAVQTYSAAKSELDAIVTGSTEKIQ